MVSPSYSTPVTTSVPVGRREPNAASQAAEAVVHFVVREVLEIDDVLRRLRDRPARNSFGERSAGSERSEQVPALRARPRDPDASVAGRAPIDRGACTHDRTALEDWARRAPGALRTSRIDVLQQVHDLDGDQVDQRLLRRRARRRARRASATGNRSRSRVRRAGGSFRSRRRRGARLGQPCEATSVHQTAVQNSFRACQSSDCSNELRGSTASRIRSNGLSCLTARPMPVVSKAMMRCDPRCERVGQERPALGCREVGQPLGRRHDPGMPSLNCLKAHASDSRTGLR